MEYVNLAAILWLTFYVIYSACLVNNNIGRKIAKLNMMPFVLSVISLITLGIHIVGDLL